MENRKSLSKIKLAIVIAIVWLFGAIPAIHAQETTWVLDETNDLTEETLNYVTTLNEDVFSEFDIQPQLGIEILTSSPEGYADIDEYRSERFKELGVGSKENDSGILLVIDLEERQIGIETGYGVEDIVRDIDAGQIIAGDMKTYLGEYMENSNPEDLNNAILQASNELKELLAKGNSGILFEEREANQLRKEEEFHTLLTVITGIAGFLGFKIISDKRDEKKLKEVKEKATRSITDYYTENMPNTIKTELPVDTFQYRLQENIGDYYDKYVSNEPYENLWVHREQIIIDMRVANYKELIKQATDLPLDIEVYLSLADVYKSEIENNAEYAINDQMVTTERYFNDKVEEVNNHIDQLNATVAEEVNRYKKKEEGYSPSVFNKNLIVTQLVNKYHLNKGGIINQNFKLPDDKVIKRDIEQILFSQLVDDVINKEFSSTSFGYGSKSGFLSKLLTASVGSLGIMTFLSRDKLVHHVQGLLGTYLAEEKRKEEERIRRAKKRRREEEERRRRAAMTSSSSSSSRSSGGSFGGGFGGGSSGGGGASGGF